MTILKFMLRACLTSLAVLIVAIPPVAWAQMTSPPVAGEQVKMEKHSADWAETRIAKLHKDLHITAAQEPAWNDVAVIMRDNAKSMKSLIDKWAAESPRMTALDSLRMHGEMADEHAKGTHKLLPAFEKLFNMMSEEQKTIANLLFARQGEHKRHKGK